MAKRNLELYVHIPFCVKKCDYCDFLSFPADDRTQKEYVEGLCREITYYGSIMPRVGDYTVPTLFFGGGTPSWLDTEDLITILDCLRKNFNIQENAEITIECNPGTVTAQKLLSYRNAGINRLSIGCQSCDDAELKCLGRIHTYEQFLKTYEMARNAGFSNINVDLISCLPNQDRNKFLHSLQKIVQLKPEHISVYTLIIEKGTPFYDRYKFDDVKQQAGMKTDVLPDEDEAYAIYKVTQTFLKEMGYEQYEISNYAKRQMACRHNMGYWKRENYLGLGLGASSLVENVRYTNESDLYSYLKGTACITKNDEFPGFATNLHASANALSRKEQMEEFMFLGLRMPEGIYRKEFADTFGCDIETVYKSSLDELKEQELLVAREGRIYLTDKGLDLSNYALAKFLI